MGAVRTIDPVFLSEDQHILESGKIAVFYWRDNTVNGLLSRAEYIQEAF